MIINIEGLEVLARHGVLESEKKNAQKFIFDANIDMGFTYAQVTDKIEDTIDYSRVCALIEKTAKGNCFDLIEKLAYECAAEVMAAFPRVQKISLVCKKPQAPLTQKVGCVSVQTELKRSEVYLSLGSSLGDREGYIKKAIALLDENRAINVEKVSDFVESEPYGGVAKNKFLNCAVKINTFLPPHILLDEIQKIESECGRVRKVHWEDRTLDIDIIFYGDERICDERLTIPHPDYAKRPFVVEPLKSIAPHKLT